MSTTMPPSDDDDREYVIGEPHPQTDTHPTVETKPSPPAYTGGGYEHARSTEYRPHTPTDGSESVYCSIHRLSAVVWCYSDDWTVGEILADLDGKDVHHKSGVPWDNRPANLSVESHSRHSSITQSQRRAWAADAKRRARKRDHEPLANTDGPACDECGTTDAPLARGEGFDGRRCPECVREYQRTQAALEELEDAE